MPLLQDIQKYSIDTSTLSKDKEFLGTIGNKLRRASKDEITPELIHAVAEFLNELFIKLDDNEKLNDKLEKTLNELRGEAYGLEQKIDEKNLDGKYFTNALDLGSRIFKFSKTLSFLLAGILLDSYPPHFWG